MSCSHGRGTCVPYRAAIGRWTADELVSRRFGGFGPTSTRRKLGYDGRRKRAAKRMQLLLHQELQPTSRNLATNSRLWILQVHRWGTFCTCIMYTTTSAVYCLTPSSRDGGWCTFLPNGVALYLQGMGSFAAVVVTEHPAEVRAHGSAIRVDENSAVVVLVGRSRSRR